MSEQEVQDALNAISTAETVLDFHSKVHRIDNRPTSPARKAIRKLVRSFEDLPAITINISNKKLPNVEIRERYMKADRYSVTKQQELIPIFEESSFRNNCRATVTHVNVGTWSFGLSVTISTQDAWNKLVILAGQGRILNTMPWAAPAMAITPANAFTGYVHPVPEDVLIRYWQIDFTTKRKFIKFKKEAERDYCRSAFLLTEYDYIVGALDAVELQRRLRAGKLERIQIQRTLPAQRFLTDNMNDNEKIDSKRSAGVAKLAVRTLGLDKPAGDKVAIKMAEHNKDFAKQKTSHLKEHPGVTDGTHSLYEPDFYPGLRHFAENNMQDTGKIFLGFSTIERMYGGGGPPHYEFDRTVDASFKYLDNLQYALRTTKEHIDDKFGENAATCTQMKHIAETLALSMWLHVYAAHILFIEFLSMWMGSKEETERMFRDTDYAWSDEIDDAPHGALRLLYSSGNAFFSQNKDARSRYDAFYALTQLGYTKKQILDLKPAESWTFNSARGGLRTRGREMDMSWEYLLDQYWTKLQDNPGVDTFERNSGIKFQNFEELHNLPTWQGDFDTMIATLADKPSYVDSSISYLLDYNAKKLTKEPCTVLPTKEWKVKNDAIDPDNPDGHGVLDYHRLMDVWLSPYLPFGPAPAPVTGFARVRKRDFRGQMSVILQLGSKILDFPSQMTLENDSTEKTMPDMYSKLTLTVTVRDAAPAAAAPAAAPAAVPAAAPAAVPAAAPAARPEFATRDFQADAKKLDEQRLFTTGVDEGLNGIVDFNDGANPRKLRRQNMLSGRFDVAAVDNYVLCSSTYESDALHRKIANLAGVVFWESTHATAANVGVPPDFDRTRGIPDGIRNKYKANNNGSDDWAWIYADDNDSLYPDTIRQAKATKTTYKEIVQEYCRLLQSKQSPNHWGFAKRTPNAVTTEDLQKQSLFVASDNFEDTKYEPMPLPGMFHHLVAIEHTEGGDISDTLDRIRHISDRKGANELTKPYLELADQGLKRDGSEDLAKWYGKNIVECIASTRVRYRIDTVKEDLGAGQCALLFKFEYAKPIDMFPASALLHCTVGHEGRIYERPLLDEDYVEKLSPEATEEGHASYPTTFTQVKTNDEIEVFFPLVWVGPFPAKDTYDDGKMDWDLNQTSGLYVPKYDKNELLAYHTWKETPDKDMIEAFSEKAKEKAKEETDGATTDSAPINSAAESTSGSGGGEQTETQPKVAATGGNPTFRHPLLEQYTFVVSELVTAEFLTVVFVFLFNLPGLSTAAQVVLGLLIACMAIYNLYMAYYCTAWPFKARKRAPSILQLLNPYRVNLSNMLFWVFFWLPLVFMWGNYPTMGNGVVPLFATSYYTRPTYPQQCSNLINCARHKTKTTCQADSGLCKSLCTAQGNSAVFEDCSVSTSVFQRCYETKAVKTGEFVCTERLPALPASDVDAQNACALNDKCGASVGKKMYGSCWKWNKPAIAAGVTSKELDVDDDNGYKQFDTSDAKHLVEYPKHSGVLWYWYQASSSAITAVTVTKDGLYFIKEGPVTLYCDNIFAQRTRNANPTPPGSRTFPGFVLIFGVAVLLSKFSPKRKFLPAMVTITALTLSALSISNDWSTITQVQLICITLASGTMYFLAGSADKWQRNVENKETQKCYDLQMSQMSTNKSGRLGVNVWIFTLIIWSIVPLALGANMALLYFCGFFLLLIVTLAISITSSGRTQKYINFLQTTIAMGDVGILTHVRNVMAASGGRKIPDWYNIYSFTKPLKHAYDEEAVNFASSNTIIENPQVQENLLKNAGFSIAAQVAILFAATVITWISVYTSDPDPGKGDMKDIGVAIATAVLWALETYYLSKQAKEEVVEIAITAKWTLVDANATALFVMCTLYFLMRVGNYLPPQDTFFFWPILPVCVYLYVWESRRNHKPLAPPRSGENAVRRKFERKVMAAMPMKNAQKMLRALRHVAWMKTDDGTRAGLYYKRCFLQWKPDSKSESITTGVELKWNDSMARPIKEGEEGERGRMKLAFPLTYACAGIGLIVAAAVHRQGVQQKADQMWRVDKDIQLMAQNAILCGARIFVLISFGLAYAKTINFNTQDSVWYPKTADDGILCAVRICESLNMRRTMGLICITDMPLNLIVSLPSKSDNGEINDLAVGFVAFVSCCHLMFWVVSRWSHSERNEGEETDVHNRKYSNAHLWFCIWESAFVSLNLLHTPVDNDEPMHDLASLIMWILFGVKAILLPVMWYFFARYDTCFYAVPSLWSPEGSATRDVFMTPPFVYISKILGPLGNRLQGFLEQHNCFQKRLATRGPAAERLATAVSGLIGRSIDNSNSDRRTTFIERRAYTNPT